MVVFFIAFTWIHRSTPLIRLYLLLLILLFMPTLNFLPVWFVLFIAIRWIHLSTPIIRLFLLVLILLLMPPINCLSVWFVLSLLGFRVPSRLAMMFILCFFFKKKTAYEM